MRNLFGSAKNELMPGAKNAVETCLAVRSGENVALIADEVSNATGATTVGVLIWDEELKLLRPVPGAFGAFAFAAWTASR